MHVPLESTVVDLCATGCEGGGQLRSSKSRGGASLTLAMGQAADAVCSLGPGQDSRQKTARGSGIVDGDRHIKIGRHGIHVSSHTKNAYVHVCMCLYIYIEGEIYAIYVCMHATSACNLCRHANLRMYVCMYVCTYVTHVMRVTCVIQIEYNVM